VIIVYELPSSIIGIVSNQIKPSIHQINHSNQSTNQSINLTRSILVGEESECTSGSVQRMDAS